MAAEASTLTSTMGGKEFAGYKPQRQPPACRSLLPFQPHGWFPVGLTISLMVCLVSFQDCRLRGGR